MKHVLLAALVSLGIVGCGTAASASTVTYTYSGVVLDQLDNDNQFSGMNLVGQSFTDVETFDLGTGQSFSNSQGYGFEGGALTGTPVFANSVLTVGGLTLTTSGTYDGLLKLNYPQQYVVSLPSSVYTNIIGPNSASNYKIVDESFAGSGLGDGYHSVTLTGNGLGDYEFASGRDFNLTYSSLFLKSDKLVISFDIGVSAVPLPASAPMFGAALLALGAIGIGRKRKLSTLGA